MPRSSFDDFYEGLHHLCPAKKQTRKERSSNIFGLNLSATYSEYITEVSKVCVLSWAQKQKVFAKRPDLSTSNK